MKYLNGFISRLGLCVNSILKWYYNILVIILNSYNVKVVRVESIDLNNINSPLVKFKLEEINYNNIKSIIKDSFNSGSGGDRYMHIFTNKGHFIISFKWSVVILSNDEDLLLLCLLIRENCNKFVMNTKSLFGLSGDDFYMYITDKDIEGEKELYGLIHPSIKQK